MLRAARILLVAAMLAAGCRGATVDGEVVLTFPASAVGREAELLDTQLARFRRAHPDIRIDRQKTPDEGDQRHQLYVQWLVAGASDPDVLQLDVVWAAEFANARWIAPLGELEPDVDDFVAASVTAATWKGELYALPWFVDVGMLYYRSDLFDQAPAHQSDLRRMIDAGREALGARVHGLVWQGNRYEGLITVFLEYLGAHGGAILDPGGAVVVDAPEAVAALRAMRSAIERGDVPRDVLTWDEEKTRFAFQRGDALMMRNWPYAIAAMRSDPASEVRGAFAVAPIPPAPGGRPSAALGGQLLAINRNSDHPRAAWELVRFLTAPEQMAERARVAAQFPARRSVYDDDLGDALGLPAGDALAIVDAALPRPVTPLYAQLSETLQIHVHRALAGEEEPQDALAAAARTLRRLFAEARR